MERPTSKPSKAQMEEILKATDRERVRNMSLPESKPSEKEIAEMKEAGRQEFRDNKQRVIDHLKKRGLSNAAIAGIVGNIDVETGGSFDYTQRQTRSGNPRDPRTIESGGYGLFQFDDPRNKAGHETWYKQYLEDKNKEDSAESQLDYFLDMVMAGEDSQDPNYKYAKNMGGGNAGTIKAYLQTNTNPAQISDAITDRFELPGIQHSDRRRESAKKTFAELAPLERNEFVPSIPDESDPAQYLNQPGEIRDTDTEVPIVDVPDDESTFQKIKPYIPILRHFNEGGMSTTESEMQTYPITEDMIESLNSMTEEEREAFRKRIMSRAIEDMQRGERFMKPLSTEGENSLKKLRRYYEKGGIAKQMELFEDGGLMDEGGTVDPVSGNDVPPGSTQEEVRDDIPAQLSEGEFVFPADVVRFIGLEKLMQMRQQAKMGLQTMEDMGQMGNSDEAIMPDDLPFDINDLDMEDDLEYNVGGFVPGQSNPYGIAGTQQSAFAGGVGGYMPYQMPQYGQTPMAQAYVPAQQQFVPTQPVPTTLPTPEQFLPKTPTDPEVTTKEYINPETGEKRVITFVGGQPTIAIPDGFITMEEYQKTQPPKTEVTPATPETTRVVERDDSDDDRRRREEEEMFGPGGGRLGVGGETYGVSFDMPEGFMPGAMGVAGTAFGLLSGKPLPSGVTVNFQRGKDKFKLTGDEYNRLKTSIDESGANSPATSDLLANIKQDALTREANKRVAEQERIAKETREQLKRANELASNDEERDRIFDNIIQQKIKEATKEVAADTGYDEDLGSAPTAGTGKTRAELTRERNESYFGDIGGGSDSSSGQSSGGGRTGSSSTDWSQPDSSASVGSQSDYDKMYGNQGGLASKPKPKVKKMKQGGLASKKIVHTYVGYPNPPPGRGYGWPQLGEVKMAEAEIMAEEMQSPKKVAFANRKYSNEDKRKMEEEELEQMLKEQRGEVEQEAAEPEEEEPTNAEEKTFKKRYSDLRRHQQKQAEEFKTELEALKRQLSEATKKEMKLPKSDEDIEQWAKEYPDVAAIVETIAMKKAREQSTALEERLRAIDEMQMSATKEKAEAELMRIHPDFDEIRDSDEFHEWAEDQPKWVQDALYDNDNDARSAARAIDLYKADMGITTKKKPKSDKDAAKSVSTKNSRSKPQENEASTYLKESQVQKMSPQEYEKHSDEIMEAIRSGKFIYDVSGSAR